MPFLAILRLIPLKDWLYGSAIVALLVGFTLYAHHERAIGAAHERGAVAAAVAKQVAANAKVVSNANTSIAQADLGARVALASAPTDSPHVIVRNCPAARAVQADRSAGPDIHVPAESTVENPIDIGPPLDTIGRDADTQIAYLQAYIRACQAAGYCSK